MDPDLPKHTNPSSSLTMARILITGSSDGLGSIVAQKLISRGHSVVLHARNAQRAKDASAAAPGAEETVVTGDLSDMASTKAMAKQINDLGSFDCIIHNAGLYQGGFRKTSDGIPALAAVNTLAPYILTALVKKPKRLVFLSSEMHQSGSADLSDPLWTKGETGFSDTAAYCASKLHNILFAKAFARRWPDVQSNALDPGWVATKMGGSAATGSADAAVETYVMLAEGEEESAKKTGHYFRPGKKLGSPQKATEDEKLQDRLLEVCGEFSGVKLQ